MTEPRNRFAVPTSAYVLMRAVRLLGGSLRHLSRLESLTLRGALASVPIDRPVFITGCARAGTTITLEMLSRHPDVGTHRYTDFVIPFFPVWWDWLLPRLGLRGLDEPVERIHQDRIQITRASPEAIEEMLWLHFFDGLHDPDGSCVLDGSTSAPAFEHFYREHIRKLLLARRRRRYVTKNNSVATRLRYLLRLIPSARILILIRHPVSHIASLLKQHRLFCQIAATEPRQYVLTRLAGHFEFGPHRRVTHLGDPERAQEIAQCWRSGREVRGWALQWGWLYEHLSDLLEVDPGVRRACRVVRYEDLCDRPRQEIGSMLDHADLAHEPFEAELEQYAGKLSRPSYYQPDFTSRELAEIGACAGPTAARYGYDEAP